MPEYLAPGVYIEEIERGPKPIEGVATSTAAFLGETERGPTWPRLVTSYNEYLRLFGDVFADGKYLPYAVKPSSTMAAGASTSPASSGEGAAPARAASSAAITDHRDRPRARGQSHLGSTSGRARSRPAMASRSASGCRSPTGIGCRQERDPFDPFDERRKQLPRPSLTEDFDDLSLDPNSPNYWGKRVNNGDPEVSGNSSLIELEVASRRGDSPSAVRGRPAGRRRRRQPRRPDVAVRGDERRPAAAHGARARSSSTSYREVAIVYAPGSADDATSSRQVITHCEHNRFRFAVIDAAAGQRRTDHARSARRQRHQICRLLLSLDRGQRSAHRRPDR